MNYNANQKKVLHNVLTIVITWKGGQGVNRIGYTDSPCMEFILKL